MENNGVSYTKENYTHVIPITRVKELGIQTRRLTPLEIHKENLFIKTEEILGLSYV